MPKIDVKKQGWKNPKVDNWDKLIQDINLSDNLTPPTQDLSEILRRLDEQQALIDKQNELIEQLKDPEVKQETKRYEWPRAYSFKIFDGKPVLSYKSFKKESTRDWKYKTLNGQEIINHYLKLTLWNFSENKKEEMEIWFDVFQESYSGTEKIQATTVRNERDEVVWYKFTTKEFGAFTVDINCVN